MELAGIELEPCQAVVQVQTQGIGWEDYATIKDGEDVFHALRLCEQSHFRVWMRKGANRYEYHLGKWNILKEVSPES